MYLRKEVKNCKYVYQNKYEINFIAVSFMQTTLVLLSHFYIQCSYQVYFINIIVNDLHFGSLILKNKYSKCYRWYLKSLPKLEKCFNI